MSRRSRLLVPLLVAVALFGVFTVAVAQDAPPRLLQWLRFLTLLPLIFFVVRLFDYFAFDFLASRRRRRVKAPLLLREIFAVTLYFLAFGWAISAIFNYSVTGLLATGTVVAAVLGLALQETLGNVFAGIALHLEDTFDVGDVIRSGENIGVIEAVRWRGTRIRTFNNNLVVLPNSMLARERLEVFPRHNVNARVLPIGIDYNVPPARVIAVLTEAAANVEGVVREMPCLARIGGFGDSSVTYEIKYFMHDYSQRDRIDSEIRRAVWYALRRNHIPIPVPIRSLARYHAPADSHHLAPEELHARLREIDILSPLGEDAHEAIAEAAIVDVFSRGETLIRRGAAGYSMFLVHEGEVAVRVDDQEVARLGPGSVVGEMALLTGEARAADVVAVTDVVAIEISSEALQPILQTNPELAAVISEKVAARRDSLDALRAASHDEARQTILSRIRAYFGL